MISKVWLKIDPFTPNRDQGNAPVIWNPGTPLPSTALGFWLGHSFFMQVKASELSAPQGQSGWWILYSCPLCKATFLVAISDENVCKITMWCVNENADHRVPTPLIPQSGRQRLGFIVYNLSTYWKTKMEWLWSKRAHSTTFPRRGSGNFKWLVFKNFT